MDPVSAGSGAIKRLAPRIARIPRAERRRIARFTNIFCSKFLKPLERGANTSFESWIERQGTYSSARKEELTRCWEEGQDKLAGAFTINPKDKKKVYRINNFIKNEFYDAYKHPRMINSRSDFFKCLVGPTFDLVANEVFHMKYPGLDVGPLIKLTPVADRPVVLRDLLIKGRNFSVTDYTSFECHFNDQIMESIEFQVYKYMVQNLPHGEQFINLLRDSMTKSNVLHNKWFKMNLGTAKRMSGEMNTSLGNGLGNLILTLYTSNARHVLNGYNGSVESWIANYNNYMVGVFEGDDGLCVFHPDATPVAADFANLNLLVKLEVFSDLGHASFCGNLFDPVDLIQVTDPIKVLASFGWSSQKYVSARPETRLAVLRCKAMSYSHQYSGAPIIQEMAAWIMRVTSPDEVREQRYIDNLGFWYRDRYKEAYSRPVQFRPTTWRTRLLVEQLYGISPADQECAEAWFRSRDTICPINIPCLHKYVPDCWWDFNTRHLIEKYDEHGVVSVDEMTKAMDYVTRMCTLQPSFAALKQLIQ
jgi:hypothetical protein